MKLKASIKKSLFVKLSPKSKYHFSLHSPKVKAEILDHRKKKNKKKTQHNQMLAT